MLKLFVMMSIVTYMYCGSSNVHFLLTVRVSLRMEEFGVEIGVTMVSAFDAVLLHADAVPQAHKVRNDRLDARSRYRRGLRFDVIGVVCLAMAVVVNVVLSWFLAGLVVRFVSEVVKLVYETGRFDARVRQIPVLAFEVPCQMQLRFVAAVAACLGGMIEMVLLVR